MLWLLGGLGLTAAVALIAGDPDPLRRDKPELVLMTALPIVWGEGGVDELLAGGAGPSAVYSRLEEDHRLTPIDSIDSAALEGKRRMLVAQPRALAPGELVDLDAWVRAGGKALIFTDPALLWPSAFGFGDPRRPPAIGLLDPLLAHWGLELEPPAEGEPQLVVRSFGRDRVRLAAPGRFVGRGASCRVAEEGLVARCRLGAGEALLVADADLLNERLWGGGADNMAAVTAWLDELAR